MRILFYSGQEGYPEGVDVLFTPYKLNEIFPDYQNGDEFRALCLFVDPQTGSFNMSVIDHAVSQDPFWEFRKNIVYFEQKEFEINLIFRLPGQGGTEYSQTRIDKLIQKIEVEMQINGKHRYAFGLSNLHMEIETSIHEAFLCMKHRIFMEENPVVRSEDIQR